MAANPYTQGHVQRLWVGVRTATAGKDHFECECEGVCPTETWSNKVIDSYLMPFLIEEAPFTPHTSTE